MGIALALQKNVSKEEELENTAILWLKGEQQLERKKGFCFLICLLDLALYT